VIDEAVIPIFLDDTPVPGIPKDLIGIPFKVREGESLEQLAERVTDEITFKLASKLEAE
jgi:hypothetical protein